MNVRKKKEATYKEVNMKKKKRKKERASSLRVSDIKKFFLPFLFALTLVRRKWGLGTERTMINHHYRNSVLRFLYNFSTQ